MEILVVCNEVTGAPKPSLSEHESDKQGNEAGGSGLKAAANEMGEGEKKECVTVEDALIYDGPCEGQK